MTKKDGVERMNKTSRSTYSLLILCSLLVSIISFSCKGEKSGINSIGIVNTLPTLEDTVTGFKEGMRELGYYEGKNIRYHYGGPTSARIKIPLAVQSLLAAKVDLILSITTPATLAVKKATAGTGIPVVFSIVTDPVGSGIVKSIDQPGGNITGVSFGVQEARRLEWFVRIAPEIRNIYVPYNPGDKAPVLALKIVKKTAAKLGVRLITRKVYDRKTLNDSIRNFPANADSVFFLPDSLRGSRLADYVAAAMKKKLPMSVSNIDNVKKYDILTSFGFNQKMIGKQAARLADLILKGSLPAEMPVETAEFYLVINLKVAKKIGLVIPDEILRQADVIIR